MKKLLVTALLLAILTCVAGAKEIVLTVDADSRTLAVVPNDAIPYPLGIDGDGEEELSWDDGEQDGYWMDSFDRATCFTAPVDCHVVRSRVYIYDNEFPFYPYYFAIYLDNSGYPSLELGGTLTVGGEHDAWHETDLTPLGITLAEGMMFHGVVQKQLDEHPYICLDTTDPIHGCCYKDGVEWIFDQESNFMLRIVVDDDMDGPFTCNPNPAPDDTGVEGDTNISFELQDFDHEVVLETIVVAVNGEDVTDECDITEILTGGYTVFYDPPEEDFDPGEVEVYWGAEDELGNWGEDAWSFLIDDNFNIEDTSWGVIKDTF